MHQLTCNGVLEVVPLHLASCGCWVQDNEQSEAHSCEGLSSTPRERQDRQRRQSYPHLPSSSSCRHPWVHLLVVLGDLSIGYKTTNKVRLTAVKGCHQLPERDKIDRGDSLTPTSLLLLLAVILGCTWP